LSLVFRNALERDYPFTKSETRYPGASKFAFLAKVVRNVHGRGWPFAGVKSAHLRPQLREQTDGGWCADLGVGRVNVRGPSRMPAA
jgi:hypothetical protein